jgi:hypothetical protein
MYHFELAAGIGHYDQCTAGGAAGDRPAFDQERRNLACSNCLAEQ